MKITKKDKIEAAKLISSITPITGEMRTVQKCCDCGALFGRRFIPFGIGYGASYNVCACQITAHRNSITVLESTP